MSTSPADESTLPPRSRWLLVAGLSVLALPVVFSFFFFGLVAADGAGSGVGIPQGEARPWLAAALAVGAAVMAGGWAGLLPWAMGRADLIPRTFVVTVSVVGALFGVFALVG